MKKIKYNRIKTELAEADKQNAELAEYIGVHVTTVSDWCTNTNQPSIQDLFKISKFLKINVQQLLVATKWDNATDNIDIKIENQHSKRKNKAVPVKGKPASKSSVKK